MKTALINFSPRGSDSSSSIFLDYVKKSFDESVGAVSLDIKSSLFSVDYEAVLSCENLVFFYPLYVDALPSHMLLFISQLSQKLENSSVKKVYAVANCGFYEGEQTRLSFEVLKNWCASTSLEWCGGVGIGGAGCFEIFKKHDIENGPRIAINNALSFLSSNIMSGTAQCNDYVTVLFPKKMYKIAGEMLWRQKMRAMGVNPKDISKAL